MIFEKIVKILRDYKDIEAESIAPDTTFEELGLDSLDRVELAMSVEEAFSIQLELTESMRTVQGLVDAIEEQLKAGEKNA
ncbi:MAG TPA: phosphopantetheine-binding protein [Feifaniaceae bacterium]|nr:phosphopantetheine-binding protein [Feifaniaceae bacterium]